MIKGDIWLAEIPSADGHEQTGKRPVIIMADTNTNIAVIIPFTSNLQALRFLHTLQVEPSSQNGLLTPSVLLLFQIRAIDKKRLINKLGVLEKDFLEKIDKMLKELLEL